jgi:hypothetical protein
MFGTTDRLKKNLQTEIAAVLAFSASENNDKVGCIFFSDRIPTMIEMRLVGYLKAGKVRREEGAPRTAPLPVNG